MKSTAAGLIYKLGASGKMKYKLSDICTYRNGKVDVKDLNAKTYISTENMLPNKGGITEAASLPTVPLTQGYKKDDVLVSNIRPYFKKIWRAKNDGGCSNDVLVFQANENIDKEFLYYVLANDDFFAYSMATSKGTKMPRGDKFSIMQYEVPNLNFETQHKIGVLLKSLDDKIELNNKINENLEQQAQAIYQSMFVSTQHETDRIGLLSELITVKYGKDHKKLNDGFFPVYGSGGIMRYVEKSLYDKESVLIPRKGSLNNVLYVDEPFWSVDTMFFTEMKMPNIAKFVFHFVKSKDLDSLNAGSAVPSMTTDILNSMKVRIPSAERLAEFEEIVAPLYRTMKENVRQSEHLSALRDTLLPKLMNGKIDVSEVKI